MFSSSARFNHPRDIVINIPSTPRTSREIPACHDQPSKRSDSLDESCSSSDQSFDQSSSQSFDQCPTQSKDQCTTQSKDQCTTRSKDQCTTQSKDQCKTSSSNSSKPECSDQSKDKCSDSCRGITVTLSKSCSDLTSADLDQTLRTIVCHPPRKGCCYTVIYYQMNPWDYFVGRFFGIW